MNLFGIFARRIQRKFRGPFDTAPESHDSDSTPWLRRVLARPATHVAAGLAILLLDCWTGSLLMFPVLFVVPVLLSAWLCSAGLAYALAVVLPVGRASIAIFMAHSPSIVADLVNALTCIAVLGLVAFLVARTARLAKELKVLHGLLPICMFCKRIRDETGAWQRLETYISGHSEADFSHGLCPECGHKHYGSIFDKKQTAEPGGPVEAGSEAESVGRNQQSATQSPLATKGGQ